MQALECNELPKPLTSALNEDCWGTIYSKLETKQDRMSFFHTCKALHNSPAIRNQVKKLVIFIGEDMALNSTAEEEQAYVASLLQTFPGAVLRCIELHGPLPRYWTKAAGTLAHAEDITKLDIVEPVDYELLDLDTVSRLFPNLTSFEVMDAYSTVSLAPLQKLHSLTNLTIQFPFPEDGDIPDGLDAVLASCKKLECLTLSWFVSYEILRSCSIKHLRFGSISAPQLSELGYLLDHGAFPSLEWVTLDCIVLLNNIVAVQTADRSYRRASVFFAKLLLDDFNKRFMSGDPSGVSIQVHRYQTLRS